MRECLQDRRLQWLNNPDSMEESAWSSKCRIFKVSGSFLRRQSREAWIEMIRNGLQEKKVSKDLGKDRNT